MNSIKSIVRIIIGIILLMSGIALFTYYDPTKTLPILLYKSFLKVLGPHHVLFFKINTGLICAAGLLTIFGSVLGIVAQVLASTMYILTYDNFTLYENWEFKIQKIIYIVCHIVLILALCECQCTIEKKEVTKETDKTNETDKGDKTDKRTKAKKD